jgi:hypothetical protein
MNSSLRFRKLSRFLTIALSFVAMPSLAPANMFMAQSLRNGLIFELGFSEGTGTTSADKSGRARNGTFSATPPSWTASGKFGNAVLFNNSSFNQQVTIPAHTGGADFNPVEFTWMAWVKPSLDPGSSEHTVVSNSDPTVGSCSGIESYDYASCSGQPSALVNNSVGTYFTACATSKLTVGTWSHVAETFDGVNVRIYFNGVLQGTVAFSGTINTSCAGPYRIGAEPGPGGAWGEYYDGSIDDVRLYNRALSASAILTLKDIPVP